MRLTLIVLVFAIFASVVRAADEPSWSIPDTEKTPVGEITFHGPFTNERVEVAADKLPVHAFLDVSLDLLVMHSWDGSVEMKGFRPAGIGPDFFCLGLRDGPTLLATTFSNRPDDPGFDDRGKFQNFPSPVPGDQLAPQTGATAKSSLGYNYPWPGPPQLFPTDATYHIHFVIPHSQAKAVLQLYGLNLQSVADEGWGVTNLQIQPLAQDKVSALTADAVAAAFKDAMTADSANPMESFATLITGMDATVEWIRANVTPQGLNTEQLALLLQQLAADDSHIDDREGACAAIRELGAPAEPFLRDARKAAVGEQRERIDWLLEGIGVTQIDDETARKLALATRVLEIIGTPAAMELRKSLVTSK